MLLALSKAISPVVPGYLYIMVFSQNLGTSGIANEHLNLLEKLSSEDSI